MKIMTKEQVYGYLKGSIVFIESREKGEMVRKALDVLGFRFGKMQTAFYVYPYIRIEGDSYYPTYDIDDYNAEGVKRLCADDILSIQVANAKAAPKYAIGSTVYLKGISEAVRIVSFCYSDSKYTGSVGCSVEVSFREDAVSCQVAARDGSRVFRPFDRVLVRANADSEWRCALFSHMSDSCWNAGEDFCVVSDGGCYRYCIPYEGNEGLLGTTEDIGDE